MYITRRALYTFVGILVFLLVSFIGCQGCSLQKALDSIPSGEFKSFSSHRAGNVTSADITAKNAKKNANGDIVVDEVSIKLDYGPAFNLNVKLEGWKREKITNSD